MDVQQWYVESALRELDRQHPVAGAWTLPATCGVVRHRCVLRRAMHHCGGWLIEAGDWLRRASALGDDVGRRVPPPSLGRSTR